MNKIVEQAKFCDDLMKRLRQSVTHHEEFRVPRNIMYHSSVSGYGTGIVENGASKTQIQTSIVQLRRELNILSRMLED